MERRYENPESRFYWCLSIWFTIACMIFTFLSFVLSMYYNLVAMKTRSTMAVVANATPWYRRKDDAGTVPIRKNTRRLLPTVKTFLLPQGRQGLQDPREQALSFSSSRSRGPAPLSRHPASVSTPSSTPIDPTLRGWRTTHRRTASNRTTRGWCPTGFRVHWVIASLASGLIAASRASTPAKRTETWDRKSCPMGSHLFFQRGAAIYLGHAEATGDRGTYLLIFRYLATNLLEFTAVYSAAPG